MAKFKEKVVKIESGVVVKVAGSTIRAKGPKGELSILLPGDIGLDVKSDEIRLTLAGGSPQQFGLFSSLVKNMVAGVAQGYQKDLEVIGVGYKVKKEGRGLVLQIGFSHPVKYLPPPGCELEVLPDNRIVVSSPDKQLAGQVAAQIRSLKRPEPYKGKGIKYSGEVVRRKPGKAGKVGVAVK